MATPAVWQIAPFIVFDALNVPALFAASPPLWASPPRALPARPALAHALPVCPPFALLLDLDLFSSAVAPLPPPAPPSPLVWSAFCCAACVGGCRRAAAGVPGRAPLVAEPPGHRAAGGVAPPLPAAGRRAAGAAGPAVAGPTRRVAARGAARRGHPLPPLAEAIRPAAGRGGIAARDAACRGRSTRRRSRSRCRPWRRRPWRCRPKPTHPNHVNRPRRLSPRFRRPRRCWLRPQLGQPQRPYPCRRRARDLRLRRRRRRRRRRCCWRRGCAGSVRAGRGSRAAVPPSPPPPLVTDAAVRPACNSAARAVTEPPVPPVTAAPEVAARRVRPATPGGRGGAAVGATARRCSAREVPPVALPLEALAPSPRRPCRPNRRCLPSAWRSRCRLRLRRS